MKITVKIPDEITVRARERGLKVEDYVEEILAKQVRTQHPAEKRTRKPEEIRAWLDSLAQFSDKIPALPETISREWMYQEHN